MGHSPRRLNPPSFFRSFSNSAPYRWETGTGAERSNKEQREMEEIMNVDSWQQTPRTWKTNTWTKKQTLLREKNIRNEKKRRTRTAGKLQMQTHRQCRDPAWCSLSLHKQIHLLERSLATEFSRVSQSRCAEDRPRCF